MNTREVLLETGLAAESGVAPSDDPEAALIKLDAWLCDIKDMRIGEGLHVLCLGALPGDSLKKKDGYELYDNGRFFTVTGDQWPGTPSTVEYRESEIGDLERNEEYGRGDRPFGIEVVEGCFAGSGGARHNPDVRGEQRHAGRP